MRQAAQAGLRAPETYLGDDPAAEALTADGRTVAKARFGCSGAGLHFLTAGQPLPAELQTQAWVIQRRVPGREVSTLSFCRDGEILGHVVYRGLVLSGTVAVAFERIEEGAVDAWVASMSPRPAIRASSPLTSWSTTRASPGRWSAIRA
jgi:hypothetical protein